MIQWALFGAGVIGSIHARNIAAHARCRLAYVVDQDLTRAQELADQFGGEAVESIDAALGDGRVGGVIISSSTAAHYAHVLACAEAGKAFLCEKPLADDLHRARESVLTAVRAGVVAATGFNRRLDPQYRSLFERTRNGEIGAVEMLHMASRSFAPPKPETTPASGGMIREKGAHFFDLAAWISGAEPVEVFAFGACLVDPAFARYGDVDTAALAIRLDSGALATFDFGRRTSFGQDEWIEVFGAEGMLVSGRTRAGDQALYKGPSVVESGLFHSWHDRFAESYLLELDALVSALTQGTPVHASLADGLRAQAVAEAAVRSLAENKPVPIENIWS